MKKITVIVPCYNEEQAGCIAVTDELVVVRLSAQEEPPATDWW